MGQWNAIWCFPFLYRQKWYIIECCYNAVQYNMILHTSEHWLRQSMNQSFNPQNTSQTSWRGTAKFSIAKISMVFTFPVLTTLFSYILDESLWRLGLDINLITVTSLWARWRLKSPASPLFTQPFIRVLSKKTSKLRVTGLCAGNSPGTGEFPAQMASNAENVSIWWRHHVLMNLMVRDQEHYLLRQRRKGMCANTRQMRHLLKHICSLPLYCFRSS